MIKVIYRWRVGAEHRDRFAQWWHDGTIRIRATRPGALGSTLLAPSQDGSGLVAIANWRSRQDLEAFWADPGGDPFDGAALESAEVLEVVDDLTM